MEGLLYAPVEINVLLGQLGIVFGTVFLGNCLPVLIEKGVKLVLFTVLLREAKAIGRPSSHVSFESAQILANVSFCWLFPLDPGTMDIMLIHICAVVPFVSQLFPVLYFQIGLVCLFSSL